MGYGGWPFLIYLLEEEGAIQPLTTIIEDGPPGMSSAMAYLYDEDPEGVLTNAKGNLVALLG